MKTRMMALCAVFLVSPMIASADEIAKDQLIKEAGAESAAFVELPLLGDVTKEAVVSDMPKVRLSALQTERLRDLARHVHENHEDAILKGHFTTHRFKVEWHQAADGAFQLESIRLERGEEDDTTSYTFTFLIDPDGVVRDEYSKYYSNLDWTYRDVLNKKMAAMLMDEVSFWVEYETKRSIDARSARVEPAAPWPRE